MIAKGSLTEFGLHIDSPLVSPGAVNFRPPSWPPPDDWPVIIDGAGVTISRWGDSIWRLDPWAGRSITLNFGDGHVTNTVRIDQENANLLRLLAGLLIWGPNGARSVGTLTNKFSILRMCVALCSQNGILASDLARFPAVAELIPGILVPSKAAQAIIVLHEVFNYSGFLGFTLLDSVGLVRLEAALPDHETKQTPYIPPRIWAYQVTRLRECLDDYLKNMDRFEACYRYAVDAYASNSGSLESAITNSYPKHRRPFINPVGKTSGATTGCKFHGPFLETARRFGIYELLAKWVGIPPKGSPVSGIRLLASYMSLISRAGLAYIINFSLMRIEEAWNLRLDCLMVENDERFGEIYVLRSKTSKTVNDVDARWPTSPSVKVATEAMSSIARLRLICAQAHPDYTGDADENPYLIDRWYEPWAVARCGNLAVRPDFGSYYQEVIDGNPLLFDSDELRITAKDLELARFITPSLDPSIYKVGEIWPFAWHQLRRTGAVNMQSSGLVSDSTLQYLLKHASRGMSLYYGKNYSRLGVNNESRLLYVRTMYEVLGREFARLTEGRFISPHGDKRKADMVQLITVKEVNELSVAAKKGLISCRPILLGYCMSREICPYGGIDSVAQCGGGGASPCADVIYDKERLSNIKRLDALLDSRLIAAPTGSPLRESLEAQKRSVRNYLNVVS